MKRVWSLSFLAVVLAAGTANAIPARPLYELPIPPSSSAHVGIIKGSAWVGNYAKLDIIFIFEPDGTLTYNIKQKNIPNRGTWRVEGNVLTFEMVNTIKGGAPRKILEFRGVINGPDSIAGEQISAAGAKTPMTLQRTIKPAN